MSVFLFVTDTFDAPGGAASGSVSTADALPSHALRAGGGSLTLFGDLSGQAPAIHAGTGEDFVAVLGSLIYRGSASPDCLPRLLEDFSPETLDWGGMIGTHSIVIRKRGTLHIFGDGLGAVRLYSNADRTVWSNSFLAMCEITRPRRLDPQACYEYVTAGSVFGERTLVDGITALPANSILAIDETGNARVMQRPSPIRNAPPGDAATLDAIADYHCRQLDEVFGPIAANYGDRIRLSFSGGFDSRLMLAMLLRHGARPSLFVYGNEHDEDVRIAQLICRAEGLPLQCVDKSRVSTPTPDVFAAEVEQNLVAFDGWKVEVPLFDFGEDRRDRISRHADGRVPLNGSLGEIYRNFFYIPDRPSSTGAVISTFYSRYDPGAFTPRFDERRFRAAMARSMRDAIGASSDRLQRWQVEEVYPKFRGRFWTGRDAQINQRFGAMFFPYLEHAAISDTARIPLRCKDLGRLQGRMIARVDARLAGYPSDYGFALDGPRPLAYRLKTYLGTQRPPALRKLSFRLTHRRPVARGGPLDAAFLGRVIDLEFPVMRGLFNIDALNSATQYGLVATLEYLAQRLGLELPPD